MILTYDSDCVWASLDRCNPDMLKALDMALSCFEPGHFFSPAFKRHRWDGKIHFFDKKHLAFPAGLARHVLSVMETHDVPVEIVDRRPTPPWGLVAPCVPELEGITLAPDQKAAIRQTLVRLRGCLALSVGFGKTEVAAAVMKAAAPARGLFLVNKRTLMDQTADRFEIRLGERVGRVGAGWKQTNRRVTVATIQTLYTHVQKFVGFLGEQQVLIYDEAHTISPKSSFPVLRAVHAPIRLGLSATVREASRRMAIEAYLGPIIVESGEQELIQAGRAATPTVWMVRAGGMVSDTDQYQTAYTRGVVNNRGRNDLIIQAATRFRGAGLRTLILVVSIEHGRMLADALDVPFLWGNTPLDEVSKAKRDLDAGRINVLIASTIFDMGQDIPSIQVLILGGAGESPLRTIQRVGRALRRKPGADQQVRIIDFYDMAHRLLMKHSDTRLRTYKRKKFTAHVVGSLEEVT